MTISEKSIVATGHELVSQAAADVLQTGGNAFDAAVAAGFVGAVVEQSLTSLGGGGFLLARTSGKKQPVDEILFDFFVDIPGLGLKHKPEPHFFPVEVDFGGSVQEFNIGFASIAVPGTLKGLLHVHKRLGYMDLKDVLQPAIEMARGHILNSFQAVFLNLLYPIVTLNKTGRTIYEPNGVFKQPGDTIQNPGMVDFLSLLIDDNGESFYSGDIGSSIARDVKEGGGLLTVEDLSSYEVIERRPLCVKYRDYTLLTVPPPSLGGSLIGVSLMLLETMKPAGLWGSKEHLLQTTSLMREVEQLREQGISSPDSLKEYQRNGNVQQVISEIKRFSRGTTHLSIADKEGNIASMTCSNGEGSGYFVPGTGIMLNNMMGEDDLHPNGFHTGVVGERVASMMSPSALLDHEGVRLVLGSGGSKRIRTAITQVLTQFIDFKRDIMEAVHAPRLHWDGVTLQLEPGFPDDVVEELSHYVPVNVWKEQSVYFGGVHSVVPGHIGVGDPRRGGSVTVVCS